MTPHPVKRFLGVDDPSDPIALLGLDPAAGLTRPGIEAALRARLEQTYRHPAGRSSDGDLVRRLLREASSLLVKALQRSAAGPRAAPAPAPRPAAGLTDFDRYVLATIVGCGGWNARSRAKLVALAGAYGVTMQGLMKVLDGLSGRARGGHPLAVTDITSGAGWLELPPESSMLIDEILRLPSAPPPPPAESPPDPLRTLKLSMLFGAATVITCMIVLRLVLTGGPEPAGQGAPATSVLAPPRIARAPRAEETSPAGPAVARFRPLPTFLGNARPPAATDAADECPALPERLDRIARALSVSAEPSLALLRDWEASLEAMASGWVLADASTRRDVIRGVFDVLHETVDAPSLGDRMLAPLAPAGLSAAEPMSVWRSAWRAGMLGAIAGNASLPAAVVERARQMLGVALDVPPLTAPAGFDAAAGAWLAAQAPALVEMTDYQAGIEDAWEMWIAARRAIGLREEFNGALMDVVALMLATSTDLARPGPSVNVLGRMLVLADFERSVLVRERVRALFDDTERIDGHDLWVLTSLLAQLDTAPWFDAGLVLPVDDAPRLRRRVRDRILQAWPAMSLADLDEDAGAPALSVDPMLAARWTALLEIVRHEPMGFDDATRTATLVRTVRLNEAAALLGANRTVAAERLLQALEEAYAAPSPVPSAPAPPPAPAAAPRTPAATPGRATPGPGRRPVPTPRTVPGPGSEVRTSPPGGGAALGQAVGIDGRWTLEYGEARSAEQRMLLLRGLRGAAGTDLGPIDAETFVREVYRGSPVEVRDLAQSILLEQFAHAPLVGMELLDQLPEAPVTESLGETLRRLTGRVLPPSRSNSWPVQARLALLEHALGLRWDGTSLVDELAVDVVDGLLARAGLLTDDALPLAAARAPHEAARLLAEAWYERAASTLAPSVLPDDVAVLQRRQDTRRRLVRGPIQSTVAELIAALHYHAYVAVAERPALRDDVMEVLDHSAAARREASHVIEQAVLAERAMADVWRLRMARAGESAT